MIYSFWYIELNRLKLVSHFLPFYPSKNPKNQNFEQLKTKKNAGDIIILYMCIKNHNHLMYSSWDTEWDDRFFCHFGPFFFFLPFDPGSQNFEKMKGMPEDIILLYIHVYHKWKSYGSWNIRCSRQNILSFWAIFALSPPWQLGNSKF